jgi:uncharacterized membrane protein YdcZ (DUF606 family)
VWLSIKPRPFAGRHHERKYLFIGGLLGVLLVVGSFYFCSIFTSSVLHEVHKVGEGQFIDFLIRKITLNCYNS